MSFIPLFSVSILLSFLKLDRKSYIYTFTSSFLFKLNKKNAINGTIF